MTHKKNTVVLSLLIFLMSVLALNLSFPFKIHAQNESVQSLELSAAAQQLRLDPINVRAFFEWGPIPVNLTFTNSGPTHTKVYGLVNISDMFGKKVADLMVNQTTISPGASRIVKTTLNKRYLFGKYTVTAIMYYGSEKNETLTSVGSFIVIPYRAIALIVVTGLLIYGVRKHIRRGLRFNK